MLFNVLSLGIYQWFYMHGLFKGAEARGVPFLRALFWIAVVPTALLYLAAAAVVIGAFPSAEAQVGEPTMTDSPAFAPTPGDHRGLPAFATVVGILAPVTLAVFLAVQLALFKPQVVSPILLPAVLVLAGVLELMDSRAVVAAQIILAILMLIGFYELHWKMRDWFEVDTANEPGAAVAVA